MMVIDTARVYCDGTTEEVLADLHVFDKFKVATKVAPRQPGDHQPERLKAIFQKSLEALKTDKVDILYLHAPVSETFGSLLIPPRTNIDSSHTYRIIVHPSRIH